MIPHNKLKIINKKKKKSFQFQTQPHCNSFEQNYQQQSKFCLKQHQIAENAKTQLHIISSQQMGFYNDNIGPNKDSITNLRNLFDHSPLNIRQHREYIDNNKNEGINEWQIDGKGQVFKNTLLHKMQCSAEPNKSNYQRQALFYRQKYRCQTIFKTYEQKNREHMKSAKQKVNKRLDKKVINKEQKASTKNKEQTQCNNLKYKNLSHYSSKMKSKVQKPSYLLNSNTVVAMLHSLNGNCKNYNVSNNNISNQTNYYRKTAKVNLQLNVYKNKCKNINHGHHNRKCSVQYRNINMNKSNSNSLFKNQFIKKLEVDNCGDLQNKKQKNIKRILITEPIQLISQKKDNPIHKVAQRKKQRGIYPQLQKLKKLLIKQNKHLFDQSGSAPIKISKLSLNHTQPIRVQDLQ